MYSTMANIAFGAAMNGTTSIAPTVRIAFKSSISDNLLVSNKWIEKEWEPEAESLPALYACVFL